MCAGTECCQAPAPEFVDPSAGSANTCFDPLSARSTQVRGRNAGPPRIPPPSGVRARGTPVPGKAASIRSFQAAKSRPQFSAHRQRTSCGKKQSALSSHASQIHIAPNNYQWPQQDDMAFSPRAVAKFMKRLGTTLRQTKCEKVENPPPLLDYFPTHWVVVSVAMKNALFRSHNANYFFPDATA
jgi:hypothetical protein